MSVRDNPCKSVAKKNQSENSGNFLTENESFFQRISGVKIKLIPAGYPRTTGHLGYHRLIRPILNGFHHFNIHTSPQDAFNGNALTLF